MQAILDWEQENWDESWEKSMKAHPEALYAEYDILMNSKAYFLHNATTISRFPGEFFVWVDAGYSRNFSPPIPF